jgi:uncharacterized protein (DUF1697 family)
MTRYVAFLRAINVAGHNVLPMSELKRIVERLGFEGVETFIASGNVIFGAESRSAAAVERRVERGLADALGRETGAFVRTEAEVAAIARYQPFPAADVRRAAALNVAFVGAPVSPEGRRAIDALTTGIDTFHVRGREVFWMCLKKQSESRFSNAVLERTLKVPSTIRGVNTLVRLAAKLAEPGRR